ncbi:condensation protein [Nostocaceae cyanobacterium CENA357]|uniref:Condensation protein n=1 Tax=Atlanticothrix silvestris CENA357 TaxID=1725252 RepID=A0A8J7HFW5_9CYAN|nr:condensation domain-containing protein [Atlanticothrix silvestris]MBH8554251.1 condensation protein [Atlanticothrix silvestris CENA357]
MNKKNVEGIYLLSAPQQGMLFETIYAPKSGIHIEQVSCSLQGNLNIFAFKNSWQKIIERHSILRTGFVWKEQEQPLQVVLHQVEIPFEQQDWREYSPSVQQQRLEAYLQSDRSLGFNLSKPPLMRFALFQLSEETYQFVWTHHHILMDGWCSSLLLKEFLSFYQALSKGENVQLTPVRPYRDYLAWLKQQGSSKLEKFWRQTLQNFTQPTPLGVVKECDFSDLEVGYGEYCTELSASATTTIKSLIKANHLTFNTVIQGVWALLLSRYSHQDDIIFGITVSGRPASLLGAESIVGLFINTLPLRVKIYPQEKLSFWLESIQNLNLELRNYEHSNAGKVHEWSEVTGSLPLYESILVFENYPIDSTLLQSSGFKLNLNNYRSIGAQTKYALTILASVDSQLRLKFIYDKRRLDDGNVSKIGEHFITLLNSVIDGLETKLLTLIHKISTEEIPQIKQLKKLQEPASTNLLNPVEEVIAGIWSQILGLTNIDIHHNFFELGGHSLLATQVMSRLRLAFQLEIPLSYLFESPTIAELAKKIDMKMKSGQVVEATPILPVSRRENLPLSFAQQRLWFIDQLDPGNSSYNISVAVRLTGELNLIALEKSLNEVVRRHEALRTNFIEINGQPVQAIASSLTLAISLVDLTLYPQNQQPQISQKLAFTEANKPFALDKDPLLRVTILQLSATENVLLFTTHHIISDSWSMGVLIQEITNLYAAFCQQQPSPLSELLIQYADFAVWQRQWLQGEILETQLKYWQQQLGNNLTTLNLPTDRPRPEIQTFNGATARVIIPQDLTKAIKSLTINSGCTLFMTLLASFQCVLHYYTGQDDIVVGTDVANRNRADTESLIGFFVNQLVLRTNLKGNPSFNELLTRVRQVTLEAYAHQDLPFNKLVEVLNPKRDQNRTPLFQVKFVLQNAPTPPLELVGLKLSSIEFDRRAAMFDMLLNLTDTNQGLSIAVEYNTDLFDAVRINKLLEYFEIVLRQVSQQPEISLNALTEILAARNEQWRISQEQEYQNSIKQKLLNIRRR